MRVGASTKKLIKGGQNVREKTNKESDWKLRKLSNEEKYKVVDRAKYLKELN